MHEYRLPMRWADLDSLNHVNNVVYVEYADEARAAMADEGLLPPVTTRQVTVDFLRPLLLSSTPVLVRSRLEGDGLVQELSPDGSQSVFARITRVLGEPAPTTRPPEGAVTSALALRRSDTGPDGLIGTTALFRAFQEARIIGLMQVLPVLEAGRFVVGRVALDLADPVHWRPEPVSVSTAITHVSRSSFATTSWLDGGRLGRATATMVGFDLPAQRSRQLDDDERAALQAALG